MADIDKVKLEQIIDAHLQNEIPLSFLMEQYNLTYPQMKLLMNRARSYTKKSDKLHDAYPNIPYENISQDYIAIPHELEEEYPFSHEQQIALFTKLEDIKESMPPVGADIIRIIDDEIEHCRASLQSLNTDEIARAEKIAQEIEKMNENGDDFDDIFQRNFITTKDFQHLNEVYTEYLNLRDKYSTLLAKKVEAENDLKTAKRLSREVENIRESLIKHNIKLVNFCIRYFFSGIPLPQDEAQLYGIEGLVRAINGFDYKKNFQFSTFAVPVIVRTIERHFKEMTGFDWQDYCRKEFIRRYRDLYRKELGDESLEVTPKVLAESGLIPLTEKEIASNDELIEGVASFSEVQDPYIDEEEYGLRDYPSTFEDYSQLDSYIDASEASFEDLDYEAINRYINSTILDVVMKLPIRNAQILISRYGLDGSGYKSLREVGAIYGVTPERIRQIEAKGIRLLRHPFRSKKIKGLLDYYNEAVLPSLSDGIPSIKGPKGM